MEGQTRGCGDNFQDRPQRVKTRMVAGVKEQMVLVLNCVGGRVQ